jgi:molecular chaperone DnaK
VPQIEVTFDIDASGILNVSAKDRATGKAGHHHHRVLRPLEGRHRQDGAGLRDPRGRGQAAREEIEITNQADSMAYSIERQLAEHGDKVAAADKARSRTPSRRSGGARRPTTWRGSSRPARR